MTSIYDSEIIKELDSAWKLEVTLKLHLHLLMNCVSLKENFLDQQKELISIDNERFRPFMKTIFDMVCEPLFWVKEECLEPWG